MTQDYLKKIINELNNLETKYLEKDDSSENIEFLKILEKYKIKLMVTEQTFDKYTKPQLEMLEKELKKLEIQLNISLSD